MKKNFSKRRSAFTLIEILIVIAIIGVLAVVVVIALAQSAKEKARIASGQQFSDSLRANMEEGVYGNNTFGLRWKFDGSSIDEFMGLNGSLASGATISANNGISGGALVVNGAGTNRQNFYFNPSTNTIPGDFFRVNSWTINLWIKPTFLATSDDSQNIFNARYHRPRLYVSKSGSLALAVTNNNFQNHRPIFVLSNQIKKDQWQNIAVTAKIVGYDGAKEKNDYSIYLNGTLLGVNNDEYAANSGASRYIVGGASWGTENFNGLIDDFRIYGEA
ncbi:LamG domain-containing protein, partial [Patescibacteria group bacterium]